MIPIIALENLKFKYKNSVEVFSVEKLLINEGDKVFIHGPSGSGKSTLLNLMAGMTSPYEGFINILDKNISSMSSRERDRFRGDNVGYIFQRFNLLNYLTIYENILLPLKASKKRFARVVDENNEILNLAKDLSLDGLLNKRVNDLSVGQQQRVAVARALIGSPKIIIADEPTSSLDDDSTEDFMTLLMREQNSKNFTLVFVSHDKRLKRYFDKEFALNDLVSISRLGDNNA